MTKTKYIKVTIGENLYKVSAVDHPDDYDHLAMLAAIIVKLDQRVEELEMQVDDMRSIVGYGDEL